MALHVVYAQKMLGVMDVVQTVAQIMILVRIKNVRLQKGRHIVISVKKIVKKDYWVRLNHTHLLYLLKNMEKKSFWTV